MHVVVLLLGTSNHILLLVSLAMEGGFEGNVERMFWRIKLHHRMFRSSCWNGRFVSLLQIVLVMLVLLMLMMLVLIIE